jgi:hypothetical protein
MFQAHSPHISNTRITRKPRSTRYCFATRRAFIVIRAWYIPCSPNFVLLFWYAGCGEEEGGGRWCADFKCEGAVGTDYDAGGDGSAGYEVRCSSVEFL